VGYYGLNTVKASNFGPHGNVGPFFASSVASLDELCTKNEQNPICKSEAFLQLSVSTFFVRSVLNPMLLMTASPSRK
jgi:hypothetical protein